MIIVISLIVSVVFVGVSLLMIMAIFTILESIEDRRQRKIIDEIVKKRHGRMFMY